MKLSLDGPKWKDSFGRTFLALQRHSKLPVLLVCDVQSPLLVLHFDLFIFTLYSTINPVRACPIDQVQSLHHHRRPLQGHKNHK